MADYSFKLPDLGEGTVESEIVVWRAAVGAHIEADQPLVDMLTDKATIEITAPVSGTLLAVAGEPGDVIPVGAELAVFTAVSEHHPVTEGRPSPARQAGPDMLAGANEQTDTSSPHAADSSLPRPPEAGVTTNRPQASPAIRRLARERGIDLSLIQGTGPNGRITRADLDAGTDANSNPASALAAPEISTVPPAAPETSTVTPAAPETSTVPEAAPETSTVPEAAAASATKADATAVRTIKLAGLRRKIAAQMTRSAGTIPHFSYVEEADVTELERLRLHLNETRGNDRPRLTYLPFFMLALVRVAREFPQCNAHFDAEGQLLRQFNPVHIGIAVQTQNGLLAPVVRHVETLDLWQCAHELQQVAQRAKDGRAQREELSGSTITLSSLGALGGIVSTPIINYPEVAIIGINRTQQRPTLADGVVCNRLVMNISSSFDHRIIDGHDAARAIHALKRYLEFPATLFLSA